MNSNDLLANLCPPIDPDLGKALVAEFLDIERRFVLADWEPATLNGGQFAEIVARILYHLDSGQLNKRRDVDKCLSYIEDPKNQNTHKFVSRRESLHLCRAIRTIYKFRSQRGAIHIDPEYTANELDATLIISLSRWVMAEMIRTIWKGNSTEAARIVREIVRYQVPSVLNIDNRNLVLRTDCTVEEEILLLLHNTGEAGMSRTAIGSAVLSSSASITRALQRLCAADKREVLQLSNKHYILTPNGTKRILQSLGSKLALV